MKSRDYDEDRDSRRPRRRRRNDEDDRPRRRKRQEGPSAGRILAGIGICIAAAVLFVVGMIVMVRAGARARQAGGGAPPPEPPEQVERPLTLDEALVHVRGGDFSNQQKAAQALLKMPVLDQRRADVVAALRAAIDNREKHAPRHEIVEALGKWATPAETPYLLKLLDDEDGNIKIKAMAALGKLKDPRAAEPLTQRLTEGPYRAAASQALKDLGPAAEKPVAALLDHQDAGLRIEACRILKVIGTKASYPALARLAWDDTPGIAQAARDALPPDQRPPIYTMAQTIYLNIHVPDLAAWPAVEKKLYALAEGAPVLLKYHRSGEYMSVRLAPVTSAAVAFALRITFGEVGTIQPDQRVIYVTKLK